MPAQFTLLLCTYPLVVHLSVHFDHLAWAAYFMALLFALPIPYYIIKRRRPTRLGSLSIVIASLIYWFASTQAENMLFAQPIIINTVIFLLFLSTLVGDSVPIISRLAKIIKPDITEKVMSYCRWVTWAWALFFLMMALVSLYLSLYATIEAWSLFANVVTYILIGTMFIVEFAVRKILMKDQLDRGFVQFVRDLKQIDYRRVAREWRS